MNREVVSALAWAGGIIAIALAGSYARAAGHIDQDTLVRIVVGLNGPMIAYFGNRMPKAFVPSASARRVQRIGGWSMVLSGLVYGALWAFAPFDVALWLGTAAIVLGMAVTSGYALGVRAEARAH